MHLLNVVVVWFLSYLEVYYHNYLTPPSQIFFLQLEMLENQTMRDASSITRLNSELRQVNASFSQSSKTITKLQETVSYMYMYMYNIYSVDGWGV